MSTDLSNQFESVDLMDTKPPAVATKDQEMSSSPTTTTNNNDEDDGPRLTMTDIPEAMPGDEEEQIQRPEESFKPAPEESPSSPTSINSDKMPMGEDEEVGDDVEMESHKDGIVKPKKRNERKKPEMNPRYKDVQETGQWGDLSSKELYVALAVFVVVIIVVVLVVVFLVILPDSNNGGNNGVNGTGVIVPAPTSTPTMPPTKIPPEDELALVLAAVEGSPLTAPLLETALLRNNSAFYAGFMDGEGAPPSQMAMDWLLFQDDLKDPEQSVLRFAFASFYFHMDGPNWVSSENWLSSAPLCEWEHISCDSRSVLRELDLDEQNLSGTIPVEITLLAESGIQSILLSRNNIAGPIPGGVFASLPRLGILYLDNNVLTGIVPAELVTDVRLHTLYVQANQLTGEWPAEFCAEGTTLSDFGLDCDKLTCNPECCTPLECYYSS